MSYRIIIEDDKGLHQAILDETKEAKEVIHNINNILKMSDITDYIFIYDLKNYKGCNCSVHGNAEKVVLMYDCLTKFLISKDPGIILCVMLHGIMEKELQND